MARHLLFYDGECGLCDHIVQFVLKVDKSKVFQFAPLQGETAKKELKNLPDEIKHADSLILIENFNSSSPEIWVYGRGAFKVAWLLGGLWKIIGSISFLPPFLYDWGYHLIAKNRQKLFSKDSCRIPDSSEIDRFLP